MGRSYYFRIVHYVKVCRAGLVDISDDESVYDYLLEHRPGDEVIIPGGTSIFDVLDSFDDEPRKKKRRASCSSYDDAIIVLSDVTKECYKGQTEEWRDDICLARLSEFGIYDVDKTKVGCVAKGYLGD
jgi:hypothetical protein